jgi:hypothetical protein
MRFNLVGALRAIALVAVFTALPIILESDNDTVISPKVNQACADEGCCFEPGAWCDFGPVPTQSHRYYASGTCS